MLVKRKNPEAYTPFLMSCYLDNVLSLKLVLPSRSATLLSSNMFAGIYPSPLDFSIFIVMLWVCRVMLRVHISGRLIIHSLQHSKALYYFLIFVHFIL